MKNEMRMKFLSGTLGARRASWILDPDHDPVGLRVMASGVNEVSMSVRHRGGEYFLYLDLTGAGRHHCTCWDFSPRQFSRKRPRAKYLYCRHVVAAALKINRQELLLPLLLSNGHVH